MREIETKLYYKDFRDLSKAYVKQIVNLIENETVILYSPSSNKSVILGQKDRNQLQYESVGINDLIKSIKFNKPGFLDVLDRYGFSKDYKLIKLGTDKVNFVNTFVSKFDNFAYEVVLRNEKHSYFEISEAVCEKVESFSRSEISKVYM